VASLPPQDGGAANEISNESVTGDVPLVMFAYEDSSKNKALNKGLKDLLSNNVLPKGMVSATPPHPYEKYWKIRSTPTTARMVSRPHGSVPTELLNVMVDPKQWLGDAQAKLTGNFSAVLPFLQFDIVGDISIPITLTEQGQEVSFKVYFTPPARASPTEMAAMADLVQVGASTNIPMNFLSFQPVINVGLPPLMTQQDWASQQTYPIGSATNATTFDTWFAPTTAWNDLLTYAQTCVTCHNPEN
ncbi:hypothetical protein BGZ83_000393, partial [Gryganskiella cystojenkinii]